MKSFGMLNIVAIVVVAGFAVLRGDSAYACAGCGCTDAPKTMPVGPGGDIVSTAASAGSFKTLLAAAKAAGLVDALRGDDPLTVFAPTDDAFAKLPEGTVANLLKPENKAALAGILKYHVVAGKLDAGKVVKSGALDTLNGQRLAIQADENGVTVAGAKVVKTDIAATNGIIHVIDSVMLPTSKDIVDIAAGGDQFSTLVAAVKAAGLVEALKGDGPFTVFAPTNDAFAKLPKGTVESLVKPENKDKLIAILTYHVVPGRVYSDAAAAGATAKTLQGATVTTRSDDGKVFVNGAQVIAADIDTANGVIHVIDTVILPPTDEQAAAMMIERTIAQGVNVFNAGHHGRCAKLYGRTLMALASHDGIDPQMQRVIKLRHAQAQDTHHMGRRAWIHRATLDMVYAGLGVADVTRMAAID